MRLAICLDELVKNEPDSPLRKHRLELLGFQICKQLVSTLFKVIGKKRRAIVTERPTFMKNGDSELDDQELKLKDDLIEWSNIEPELDHFNKESVMSGLKFLAKRTHALPDEEAAYIF